MDHPAWPARNLLDVRPVADFRKGHPAGAVSHPVCGKAPGGDSGADWEERLPSIFLPPRHEPLLVVGGEPDSTLRLARHLQGRGRETVDALVLPPGSASPSNVPWERGSSRRHLWQPPHYLTQHTRLLPPPAAGPVLDLACGSGRAAVWLAERGYRVTGIDWQPEALAMGRRLAAGRGVECRFLDADLRDRAAVPAGPWAAILNFRFLQRELLERTHEWLQPAGVVLLRTFREAPGYDGHPHPRHRLAPGELLRFFPAGHFEILAHEENFDPDGRPAAGIAARRRFILPDRTR